jgi:hypothetical protein
MTAKPRRRTKVGASEKEKQMTARRYSRPTLRQLDKSLKEMTTEQNQAVLAATSKLHAVIAKHEKSLEVYKGTREIRFHNLATLLTYLQDDLQAAQEAVETMEIAYACFERPKSAA